MNKITLTVWDNEETGQTELTLDADKAFLPHDPKSEAEELISHILGFLHENDIVSIQAVDGKKVSREH